jgi:hypothetical protein
MNLRDQLADLAGSPGEPTTLQAEADLFRGRTALRRRRVLQGAAGSTFAIAVAAAALAFTTASGPAGGAAPLAGGTKPAVTTDSASTATFQLVAYSGAQPAGFSVDKVPAGWEVQGITDYALTLAPKGAKPRNSAEPQGDVADTDPDSFVGKVAVGLQSSDEKGTPAGETVTVAGRKGTLVDKGGARTLYLPQPSGVNLQIQVWDGIDWSVAQITEFAAGIHVNPNAKQGRG